MEPNPGPDPDRPGPDSRHLDVVQLICRAYGLADASEITEEHIHRYVAEHPDADGRTGQPRGRPRPRIPQQRTSGGAA
ncbi:MULTISPECIES: hypothetical protein [unclassified Streptomyces]|uniref:hypothetical protein n=1 Tax=unclassified Streptomyces TaxID=2593676 RepID=UPI00035E7921|nr:MULTISPECIES: hypothetical protein [unclassified Streptomyces]MYT30439.1 hypothetical protein [Streptomyces sp. SID8354]